MDRKELRGELALRLVNTKVARAPRFRVAAQRNVTRSMAATAVSLVAHWGMSSGDTSSRVVCHRSLFKYSAKMRLITAFPPDRGKKS